jgi:hypothetical protein
MLSKAIVTVRLKLISELLIFSCPNMFPLFYIGIIFIYAAVNSKNYFEHK